MIYHFWNRETFEYVESLDVKEGRVPQNGTPIQANTDIPINSKLIWSPENSQWIEKNPKEFTEHLIDLGVKSITDLQRVNDAGEIVSKTRIELIDENLLDRETVLLQKKTEISIKTKTKIESGFESIAKGQWYIYDSELEDQFNLKSLSEMGQDFPFRCTKKSNGIKEFYVHTSAQLIQIVQEFAVHKMGILANAHGQKVAVMAMETALEIENHEVIL